MHGFLRFGAIGCSTFGDGAASQSVLARGCDSGRFRVRIFRVFTSNWWRSINRTLLKRAKLRASARDKQTAEANSLLGR
jgi:hypothetical protein